MEETIDQLAKLNKMFDYINDQTHNNKETGIICEKLGLDNPHISRKRSIEEYEVLADKMIKFRKMLKGNG